MNQFLESINQQIKELAAVYRDAVAESDVSENEFWIWYTLLNMGQDYTQQDICNAWSLSKQTVNTIIMHMVQKGYAELCPIPHTKNRKRIVLTETGKQYGKTLVTPISQAEQCALEALSSEERLACSSALRHYIDLLRSALQHSDIGGEG